MTLRIRNLGSGSSGNATLIEASSGVCRSHVLVDCGLSLTELEYRMQASGLNLTDLDAVFVTHEHSDHWGRATGALCRQLGIPIWSSRGTLDAMIADAGETLEGLDWRLARDGVPIAVGEVQVWPFTVPHDAREPLQLCCTDGDRSFGILTDLGHASAHVVRSLQGLHGLLLETNHDSDLLSRSAYPAFLKQRIASDLGHLSNTQSAQLLQSLLHPGLSLVLAAHLSARNNTPELASAALASVIGCVSSDVPVADPVGGSTWFTV